MATSTLLQLLDSTYGDGTTAIGITASNRRQIETFKSNDAIAVGDALSLDLAQVKDGDKALYVKRADTGTDATRCGIGIALSPAAAGDDVQVCIAGLCEAKVKAGTAIGDRMSIYNTTPGVLEPYAAAFEDPILAVAAKAESGGTSLVFVLKQF